MRLSGLESWKFNVERLKVSIFKGGRESGQVRCNARLNEAAGAAWV